MPTASRPVIETCRITLKRLIEDRNRGSMAANSTISAMRNSVGANLATKPKTSTPSSWLGSGFSRRSSRASSSRERGLARAVVEGHHRHQDFLGRVVAGDLAGHPALAHGDDAV